MKKLLKKAGKILKPALPIAGALIGGWLGGKIGGVLGGALGRNIGRAVGGVAGGMIGASAGGTLQGSQSIQMQVPPYAQQGANILMQLLNQTPNFAQTTATLTRPYIDMAISSMKTMPSDLRSVFGEAEGDIRRNFSDLLSTQQSIIQAEQSRQNMRLGALGLLNTQAQQWTMADILNRTAFETLRDQTQALTNLIGARTQALTNHLFMRPEFYTNITDKLVQSDPQLLEYQTKMDIAKALMGVPTIAQPVYKKGLLDYLPAFGQMATAYWLLRR
jgi:hypothetical protein